MTISYLGSKARFAKEILAITLADRGDRPYIEPFVGSAAVIANVTGKRIGGDRNRFMIALHKAVRDGWEPPLAVTPAEYKEMKRNPSAYPPHLIAFVAVGCSFGSKWFGGYARNNQGTDYCGQARNAVLRDAEKLKGCEFIATEYKDLELPAEPCLIYCDPPYADSTGYQTSHNHFSSMNFWRWADRRVAEGHQVFVSEYKAPDGWVSVWEREVTTNFDSERAKGAGGKQTTEKLFKKAA